MARYWSIPILMKHPLERDLLSFELGVVIRTRVSSFYTDKPPK